jgi:hypothetical protein
MSVCLYPLRPDLRSTVCGAVAAVIFLSGVARADDPKPASVPAAPPALQFSFRTSPYRPMAGSPATLTATIKAPDTEKKRALAGLFYVREDLGQIVFNEPIRKDEKDMATAEDAVTLPSGGEWRVFGNVVTEIDAEKGETSETIVGPVKLLIDGARPVREPLIPQMMPSVRTTAYSLNLKQPTRIIAEEAQTLIFTLQDAQGQQVSDTDLWRNALAHLVLVDKDVKTLLHITPDPTDPRTGRTGTLVFPTRFPKSGIWRGWVVFHRNAQAFTLPLVFRVSNR